MSGKSPENVSKDFEELLSFLSARRVRALVVGGYAFSFHARPRYTKDLDSQQKSRGRPQDQADVAVLEFFRDSGKP